MIEQAAGAVPGGCQRAIGVHFPSGPLAVYYARPMTPLLRALERVH